ncbi:MAG: DNA-directed RNA polymerase subunit omega [Spirochaetia bacterium]|jgi:DNA-directed RNA polymerase subunit K/omega|nr:DNA-directed RNA polymerase subunit omega [Spirochaetia bacterium]
MGIPLDVLISKDRNAYTMTCAVIKRADQIVATGEDFEIADKGEKVVTESIDQVLSGKVEYQLEE